MKKTIYNLLIIASLAGLMTAGVLMSDKGEKIGADDKKVKEWEKPGKEHLKLKAPKEKIRNSRIEKIRVRTELKIGAGASSTDELLDDSNSTTTDIVVYDYVSTTTLPAEEGEIIDKRTETTQTFDLGENEYRMKVHSKEFSVYEDPEWKEVISGATTTLEAFNEQMADKTSFLDLLFGANQAVALTSTSSTNNGDTDIRSGNVTLNRGSATEFATGYHTGATNLKMRGLIQWTLPSDPGGTTISDIKLWLYNAGATQVAGTYNCHQLTRTFVESQVTWNVYSTGNNWTTAGGDYNATVISSSTNVTNNTWSTFYIRGSQSYNPITTLTWGNTVGFEIIRSSEAGDAYNDWQSKENSTATIRPYLEITYTTGGGATSTPVSSIINFE